MLATRAKDSSIHHSSQPCKDEGMLALIGSHGHVQLLLLLTKAALCLK